GNYGHPLVIGLSTDGNYDQAGAGSTTTFGQGSLPPIGSELTNAGGMANYNDPIYCFYAAAKGNPAAASTSPTNSVQRMYWDFNHGSQGNGAWPSEAPSGLDIYTNSMIPGWKNSLLLASLKGGKVIRMKLTSSGDAIAPNPEDTTNYFRSTNRFRDIALSPDGNSIFTIIDKSSTTSGPTTGNPIISACGGCVQKYTFLGYAPSGGTSTIPTTITIASGKPNICENANTININSANANYWVPITDTSSNIIAEINANGNILGNVTTSLYTNSGTIREKQYSHALYLDRNITITPQTQPGSAVSIRLYLTNAEFTALKNGVNSLSQASGVGSITNLSIFKNSDPCGSKLASAAAAITTTNKGAFGAGGYVVQASISSFSSFYFANVSALLPVNLVSFKGNVSNDIALLKWVTEDEQGTKAFILERSLNSRDFEPVASVPATSGAGQKQYSYPDSAISKLSSPVVYYRLKITDTDDKYRYSSVVSLYTGKGKGMISVHPNPVISNVTVELNAV
ncbi:MAG: PQQ-dependent sugar dehydrogenase, partial [Bacteroidota bacterium]